MPKRKERDTEPVQAELPLAKYLASTEKRVRDRAIRSLAAYLQNCAQEGGLSISQAELAKLWKGIFYCFWMSDKPLVQQALAQELADLVLYTAGDFSETDETSLDGDAGRNRALSALDFYHGFWTTIEAEWFGIDKYRTNKYYLLMRRMLNAGLTLLLLHGWHPTLLKRFALVMGGKDGPLAANNVQIPDSIRYHVCDIFLDELESVSGKNDEKIPLLPLITPFLELAAKSTSKRVYERVMSCVITPLLDAAKKEIVQKPSDYPQLLQRAVVAVEDDGDESENDSDDDSADEQQHTDSPNQDIRRIVSVRRSILRAAFLIASGSDTYAPSRRKLYAVWQAEEAQ
ncbi:hypothetical protein MYAM1_003074 [Malassezia yamatoensis]|uniref:Nop52-domain-containing protein n=1 Tax=Malassezia yamatoensis TaxID=253288 RepID=A0AAJ5YVQ4_9BASI|nr:hypothetical protein MYAM1_003074 [Malassezia yamatoensis]